MKKSYLLLLMAMFFTGCGVMQTGAVSRAYESYKQQDYERTLELISLAQKVNEMPIELSSELNYLKAQTYAQLGMKEKSDNLYHYLSEHHKDTEYGYLAYKKWKSENPPTN